MTGGRWVSVGAERAASQGAYCLDGSTPGMWHQPAKDAASSRSWLIFLDGGAWCCACVHAPPILHESPLTARACRMPAADDINSCGSRSRGFKGSARDVKDTFWAYSGYMDGRVDVNPSFANFHRVHLHYCDGASYSGDRAEPLLHGKDQAPIYLRGRRVLQAQMQAALDLGLRSAKEVLFSGGSAGGIGALIAANWVRDMVPNARRFKILIASGFFLDQGSASSASAALPLASASSSPAAAAASSPTRPHARARAERLAGRASSTSGALPMPSLAASTSGDGTSGDGISGGEAPPGVGNGGAADGAAGEKAECHKGHGTSSSCLPWTIKMKRMCELHNCTAAAMASGCGTELHPSQRWRCLLGRHAAAHVRVPTFYINSAVDSWQVVNVWRRFPRCRWDGQSGCSPASVVAHVDETNRMMDSFMSDLRLSGALDRPGNGAFLTSCNEHVASLTKQAFGGYRNTVDGTLMRDALHRWWRAPEDDPAVRHTYLPCRLLHYPGNGSAAEGAGSGGSSGGRRGPGGNRLLGHGHLLGHHACNPSCDAYRTKRRLSQECPCSPPR